MYTSSYGDPKGKHQRFNMVLRSREAYISCIPDNCTEESNTDIMANTEAQLAGAKHLKSNAKIAITHHSRTVKSTLAQERTTAA